MLSCLNQRTVPLAYAGGSATAAWRVGFSQRKALASLPASGTEVPRGLKSAPQTSGGGIAMIKKAL